MVTRKVQEINAAMNQMDREKDVLLCQDVSEMRKDLSQLQGDVSGKREIFQPRFTL